MRVAPTAIRYAGGVFCLGVFLLPVVPTLSLLFAGVSAFILFFHRDPQRVSPKHGILAPADGRVQQITTDDSGQVTVQIFMNLHDVHVNRAPISGDVIDITHSPGANRPAFTKDSDRNERMHIEIDTSNGSYTLTQIAGAFARRIHTYPEQGETVTRGDRIGHISFGSRVDLTLPEHVNRDQLAVQEGEKTRAGETVVVAET